MAKNWQQLKAEIHAKMCDDGKLMGTHQKEHYQRELKRIEQFKGQVSYDKHRQFLEREILELEQEGY